MSRSTTEGFSEPPKGVWARGMRRQAVKAAEGERGH